MKIKISSLRIIHLIISIFIIQLISFHFNIDGVATSIMSSIVMSQSFVGALYIKARNRFLGTMLGVFFSFVVSYLFPEQPLFFLVLTLLWFTFMTILSSFVASVNAYIFQLAGYTYAFVSIPMLNDPTRALHNLIFRATNVTMGMGVLVITSLLLFMRNSNFNMNASILAIYKGASVTHKKIIYRQDITFEELKNYFYKVSGLIINKTAIKYEESLSLHQSSVFNNFTYTALYTFFYANTLRHSLHIGGCISQSIRDDYDHILNKSLQYKREWRNFNHKKENSHHFHEYAPVSLAMQRGIRTLLTSTLLFAVWYLTGWDSGNKMTILGTVYVILLSSLSDPLGGAKEILNGTVQGVIAAWIYIHLICNYTWAYNPLVLYFLIQLPFLIYGGMMLTENKKFLIGVTFLTQFYFSAQPSNPQLIDFTTYVSNSLGGIAGVGIAGLGLAIFLPERKNIKNSDLILDSIKGFLADSRNTHFDVHTQIKNMHDKIRKSGELTPHTKDDFQVLTNLMSLYIIICHVKLHNLNKRLILPLIKQLELWSKNCILSADPHCDAMLEEHIAADTGESRRVSLCIRTIINEIGALYEK